MTKPVVDFWFEFASTYSYPAAMRVEKVAKAAGVAVRWRSFLLGPIFGSQGWNDSPFNIYPVKGRYMWRDLERICAREGLPLVQPPFRFPQNGLKAARLALAGEADGWSANFVRAVYMANFAQQKDIADDATLAAILTSLGVNLDAALAAANSPENKERLKAQTTEAVARGIFGAPSFTVGDELFWGNDRLEEAINFAINPVSILAEELARTDPAVVLRMQPWMLPAPKYTMRRWDYSPPHELPVFHSCWLVLEHPKSNTGIIYSPHGFGPKSPWGLTSLGDNPTEIGMGQDSAWFETLADAFLDSWAANE